MIDIPAEAIIQLREESTNAKNFKEGDCFRIYRHYKLAQHYAQERKWWARFQTDERRKHIRRLEQTPILINGFDLLLPYIGLWDHLSASQVRQVLGLRCHEVCYSGPYPPSELFLCHIILTLIIAGITLSKGNLSPMVELLRHGKGGHGRCRVSETDRRAYAYILSG